MTGTVPRMTRARLVRDLTAFYPTLIGTRRILPPRDEFAGLTFQEHRFGRVAQSGVFRTREPFEGRERRLIVQARTGVVLQGLSFGDPTPGFFRNRFALAAAFDPPGPALAWIQTGRFGTATIERFDGSVASPADLPARDTDHRFLDGHEHWWVDSLSPNSARYSARGTSTTTLGYQGGRVIYDLPWTTHPYDTWLRAHPDVRRIRVATDFRTYLYLFRGGYHGLASEDPLVSVDWWCLETMERTAPGRDMQDSPASCGARWIVANPTEPVGLDPVIRGDFRYR